MNSQLRLNLSKTKVCLNEMKHFEELSKTLSSPLLEDKQTLFIKVTVDSSLDLDDWIAAIFKNIFLLLQLTRKFL